MGRRLPIARAAASFRGVAIAVMFLCAICAGCDNSCIAFLSNPSGGTVSASTATCPINTQTTANVRIAFSAPIDRGESWHRTGIEHIFLTLRGIDAHLSLPYGQDSSGWRDIAPRLTTRPRQIDLMSGSENSPPLSFSDEATIPAGEYTQIRMLLVSDPSVVQEIGENACGEVGLNCVMGRDADIHPIALGTNDEILIPLDGTGRTVFRVFRGTFSNLDLQFDPDFSQIYMIGAAAWVNPAFIARCDFGPFTESEAR